jgi:opacity protein-like surface antigen
VSTIKMLTHQRHHCKGVAQVHTDVSKLQLYREHQMKKLLAFAVVGMMSTPALAADLGGQGGYKDDLSGVVGPCAGVSWTGVTLSGSISTDVASAHLGSDLSASVRDVSFGARLAYDHQFQNSPLVAGVFGELNYNGVANTIGLNALSESAGVTLGVAFGNVKPFVSLSGEFVDGFNKKGIGYGGGVEFKLSQHWVAAAEWRRINWNTDVSWANVDEDRVTARIGYKF